MVLPDNYVNTEEIKNFCFDSCEFKYNYQQLIISSIIKDNTNNIIQIPIDVQDNYKCSFSGETYKLTNIYVILDYNEIQHSYERYNTGNVIGEFIMSHTHKDNGHKLNICTAIKESDGDTQLTNIITNGINKKMVLNDYISSKPYNYYYSNHESNKIVDPDTLADTDTLADPDTHWIVYDLNNHFIPFKKGSNISDEYITKKITIPKAPDNIKHIEYHEKGPQYIETTKNAKCYPVRVVDVKAKDKIEPFIFKTIFGVKNRINIIIILFGLFLGCIITLIILLSLVNNYFYNHKVKVVLFLLFVLLALIIYFVVIST